ncbi:MAG TPA: carbohydrate ABC transporter permease [Naasia sp.]
MRTSTAGRSKGAMIARGLTAHSGLLLFGLLMLYPVLWMMSSSFKTEATIFSSPGLWPTDFTFDNYAKGWSAFEPGFGTFFANSFLITALSIIGNLVSCSLAAFAFARLEFRFKRTLFALMLLTIMIPIHAIAVPQYLLFTQLGWVNTVLPLVVPKFLATDAFFVFLMTQFMRNLPRELDDAAKIDGCGFFSIFWRIILPLLLPAIATTAIFTFIWTWNDFFTPLLYLNDPAAYTVPLGLRAFQDSSGDSSWGALFAMSTLAIGPVLGFFILCQRFLINGIATTGLKA